MFKMKTSKILLAMALPVAFAACTSEEIVENSNNTNLANRQALPALAAVVESGVDSRFSWNEETFGWNKFTAEDQFAAGLTDATLYDVQDLMMTNYIYTDEAGNGKYTTTSQMVEGTYFFYSFPGFEKVASRQGVPFDLTTQKSVDFKNPTAAVEANQLFVSALYKLDAATANKALPIKFVSYWSTAALNIKNTTGDDMKVVRMMITADKDMPLRGILAPSKLGDSAKKNSEVSGLVYYNNGTNYVLPYDATAEENPEWNDIKTIDMANTDVKDGLAESTMMLTVKNGELADDEEATVYFQMPAGEYGKVTVTLFVEVPTVDDETEIKQLEAVEFAKNEYASEDSEDKDVTVFYRGGTTSAFGVEGGEIVAHEVTELDILSAADAGAYAASYEDLVEIIKAGVETKISNMGDLKIDDAVIALFKSTTAKKNLSAGEYYVFNNPIEITTAKAAVQKLENIQVADATITDGKFSVDYNLAGTIKVEEGAELTVKCTQNGKITNAGTVNVEKKTTATGNGIKVVIADAETDTYKPTTNVNLKIGGAWVDLGTWTTETLSNPSSVKLEGYPTNLKLQTSKDKNGVVEKSQYSALNLSVPYNHKIYVEADVELASNMYTNGELTINGYAENKGAIKNADIYGVWNTTAKTANGATVDNYGLLQNAVLGVDLTTALTDADGSKALAVKKATTITNKAETANIKNLTLPTTPDLVGRVDNNVGGFVSAATDVEVYATVTENTTGKINISDVNTLYLNSMAWTDAEVSSNIDYIYMDGVTLKSSKTTPDKVEFEGKTVAFENGIANQPVDFVTNAATAVKSIDGSTFNYNLWYDGTDMEDVTVKGVFTSGLTSGALNLVGVTLNKVDIADGVALNVGTKVASVDSDGNPESYTVKTTTFNDLIANDVTATTPVITQWGAVTVSNDAVLTIKNDVTLNTTGITVSGADSNVSTSKKGVLNIHGTATGTVSGNGTVNRN